MKKLSTLLLLFFALQYSYSQTKILDSSVDWNSSSKPLTVFLSDSIASAVTVIIGNAFGGADVFNASYTVGSSISIADNRLVIPLATVTPGSYYVAVEITLPDNSVQEMQFQTIF